MLLLKDIDSFKQCKIIEIRKDSARPSGLYYLWHSKAEIFMEKCKQLHMKIYLESKLNEGNQQHPEDIITIDRD